MARQLRLSENLSTFPAPARSTQSVQIDDSPNSPRCWNDGQPAPISSPIGAQRFGIGIICQERGLVPNLTVVSIGQMQLLAIARALSMNSRIILMDEPTSSLFDGSVERLFRLIAALKRRGVSIVYVSHKMDEIFRICDRVTVLRDGETIGARVIW